jgi:TonB family protein
MTWSLISVNIPRTFSLSTPTAAVHMWYRLGAILTGMIMGGSAAIFAAQIPPLPAQPAWAQTPLGVNARTRCPDLRMGDDGAVIVFWLSRSGIASQVSVKSSSGSDALDSAAVSCVSKLRFAPATTLGTGEPVDAWRQVAFRWADPGRTDQRSAAVPAQGNAPGRNESGRQANSVVVHVCADEAGRLRQAPTIVRTSGVTSVDQAAVKIAASGSAYYRPDVPSGGPAVSGCAQLAIQFDAQ